MEFVALIVVLAVLAFYEAEHAILRKDKARLDRLEVELKDGHYPNIKVDLDRLGIPTVTATTRLPEANPPYYSINSTLRGALDMAFAQLDAARKETPKEAL